MAVDPEATRRAEQQLEMVRDDWLARQGVLAVEVARRWVDDQPTDEVCLRVTVEQVLPPDDVPEGELLPRQVGDTRVQVREGGPFQPEPGGDSA
jgi:hypothetical protein